MNISKCPVPKEQKPTNEVMELSNSKFFGWPKSSKAYIFVLLKIWFFTFIVFSIISSGSVYFSQKIISYLLLSLISSLIFPLLVTLRLYLGWNHIFKRLISEKVIYEETGWYDGQSWIKPVELKEKESLIASLEVKPMLKNLIQSASVNVSLILMGILIFPYLKF